ncbi:MAG: GxxExxY protein [Verrucomicrobiales bacterium]|jgi:GxxExxY protein
MGFEWKEESHAIIGCAMEVHGVLGLGLTEKPYENAMVVELGLREIECEQQRSFPVDYKGEQVGRCVPDSIVFGKVVVDAKAISQITDGEIGQILTNGHLRKPHAGWSLIKSPLSSLLKRPLSPDSLAFIASPAGIFSAPHFHSRFPEVPLFTGAWVAAWPHHQLLSSKPPVEASSALQHKPVIRRSKSALICG